MSEEVEEYVLFLEDEEDGPLYLAAITVAEGKVEFTRFTHVDEALRFTKNEASNLLRSINKAFSHTKHHMQRVPNDW